MGPARPAIFARFGDTFIVRTGTFSASSQNGHSCAHTFTPATPAMAPTKCCGGATSPLNSAPPLFSPGSSSAGSSEFSQYREPLSSPVRRPIFGPGLCHRTRPNCANPPVLSDHPTGLRASLLGDARTRCLGPRWVIMVDQERTETQPSLLSAPPPYLVVAPGDTPRTPKDT